MVKETLSRIVNQLSRHKNEAIISVGLLTSLFGCSYSEKTQPKKPLQNQPIEEQDPQYQKLTDLYNSIDMDTLSQEEKEWLQSMDKEKRKMLVQGLAKEYPQAVNPINSVCGLEDLSDKDCILFYRIFKPLEEAEAGFYNGRVR